MGKLPDGMIEHQEFPVPIITPSTKADFGHDVDISKDEIIKRGLVSNLIIVDSESFTKAISKEVQEIWLMSVDLYW